MSEDAAEDVKPKIDLTVNYEGQSALPPPTPWISLTSDAACQIKVRANTLFKKVFEAAEVCSLPSPRAGFMFISPQKRFGKEPGTRSTH